MSWKLCSAASNPKHIFSEGDLIRLRTGSHIGQELILVRHDNGNFQWRLKNSEKVWYGWQKGMMTRQGMGEMGDFYGRTIDLWVEDKNTVNPTPAADEVPPNTLVLVSKNFTKLVNGLRLHFKPHVNHGFREFSAVVSRHRSPGSFVECIQVHVQESGKPYTTFNFTEDLDSKTVSDIPFFRNFSCYLVKNYQKPNAVTVPKPAVEEEDDADGQYIIWCPTSPKAPQKILKGRKQAKKVACEMSERHGTVFYWARLMGVAKQVTKEVVTVQRATETVTL